MSTIEILAIKLRKYRAENKISREELAFRIGISFRHLNDIENMECEIMTSTIDAIGNELNVSLSELFDYTDDDIKYLKIPKQAGVPIWKRLEAIPKTATAERIKLNVTPE